MSLLLEIFQLALEAALAHEREKAEQERNEIDNRESLL